MVWVAGKSWKFASQCDLSECLLHLITSTAWLRNKRQTWVAMHSQDQKNLSFAVFWVFHREHPSDNSTSSPRNLREGTDENPAGSIGIIPSPNRFYSTNLPLPSGKTELQLPASLEIHPEEPKRGEGKAKKLQHYVVKPQGPKWAEQAGKSSLTLLSSREINAWWRCALSRPPREHLQG